MPHPPGSEPLDLLLGQVSRLHFTRAHTLLETLGLYRGQPPVLRALCEQEGLTHTELAERLHVTPATMTKMLQRMEKAGFLVRRPDPEDQRVSRVYLTQSGHAIHDKLQPIWRTMETETFAGFTREERDVIRGFLLRMRENLMQATGEDTPF